MLAHIWRPAPTNALFLDSRGSSKHGNLAKALHSTDDPSAPHRYCTYIFPGAQIQELIVLADSHLQSKPRDCVYIFGGVCNITSRNRTNGQVSFDWESTTKLLDHLLAYVELGIRWICDRHPAATVVVCPLVGSHLPTIAPNYAEKQYIVDEAVAEFNRQLVGLNRRNDVAIPWISKFVHKSRHGKLKNYYIELPDGNTALTDGIHPSQHLLTLWARELHQCFEKNYLAPTHSFF